MIMILCPLVYSVNTITMRTNIMATIIMESAKVIEAATNVINNIAAKREAKDNCYIDAAMQPRKFLCFNLKTRTKKEAIKYLDESDIEGWGWRSEYAWGDLDHAKKLLKLAQHGDPVTLNEKDVRVLF